MAITTNFNLYVAVKNVINNANVFGPVFLTAVDGGTGGAACGGGTPRAGGWCWQHDPSVAYSFTGRAAALAAAGNDPDANACPLACLQKWATAGGINTDGTPPASGNLVLP